MIVVSERRGMSEPAAAREAYEAAARRTASPPRRRYLGARIARLPPA